MTAMLIICSHTLCVKANSEANVSNLKAKLQNFLAKPDLPFDSIAEFLHLEVEPLVSEGNCEAAKILLPYLNLEADPEFAGEVHNLAFKDLGEDAYVETALWLYTQNPPYSVEWTVKCMKNGHEHPRLYTLLARAYDHKLLKNDEIGQFVINKDAENGNVQSLFRKAIWQYQEKDMEQAKELLIRLISQATKPEGYDAILDDVPYYKAPMELSTRQFAGMVNASSAYQDSVVPIYTREVHWLPEGEPEIKVRANKMLGYIYLIEGEKEKGLEYLSKAVAWDWTIAQEYFNDYADSDPTGAIRLLSVAADGGSKQCALKLGLEYSTEKHIKKNPALALKYAKLGLDPDDDSGTPEFAMASALLANGRRQEAGKWMKKSASKGCEAALFVMRQLNLQY